uniref:Uncharacterized protein n=1 Tax=Onchocerca volvulus TaxID=6282 RepID=A0A8R1TTZ1_ONCVO
MGWMNHTDNNRHASSTYEGVGSDHRSFKLRISVNEMECHSRTMSARKSLKWREMSINVIVIGCVLMYLVTSLTLAHRRYIKRTRAILNISPDSTISKDDSLLNG